MTKPSVSELIYDRITHRLTKSRMDGRVLTGAEMVATKDDLTAYRAAVTAETTAAGRRVNGYPVVAEMADTAAETANQSVVVCDRGGLYHERYVVWTVRSYGYGDTEAWNGHYCDTYAQSLAVAMARAIIAP